MLLADVVATSRAVAGTRSRLAKRSAIAELLRRTEVDDLEVVVTYLAGELRQRRTGLGWASLRDLPSPAAEPSLTVQEVDATFAAMAAMSGPGSQGERSNAAAALFGAATADEQRFLAGLISGDVRQGALDSVVLDALAEASDVPAADVRRAAMLQGATPPVAVAAMTGGTEAVAAITALAPGRAVRPMLASSAPDLAAALDKIGAGVTASVDTKLDGIRIQVHRVGDDVRVFTRSLDDITERVPQIVETVRSLAADPLVLDGEALVIERDGRPAPFQDIASLGATHPRDAAPDLRSGEDVRVLSPVFFDVLHADGEDLLDRPLRDRLEVLGRIAPSLGVPRLRTADADEAQAFFAEAVAGGYEGVVVKSLDAPYDAGRRGAAWVKVKPRHTLDLVVLAVEWGSGRRKGWLSNIHLGARDPEGGFVMLGKTFKGMTDEMLQWQTERFRELADGSTDTHVVTLRPEQVVEIAFDGVQRSPRYPGGVALRFARVLRYRDDKRPEEADTIDAVRALGAGN
ncbi:ATP-dependent DNA ligase [Mumia zhuanghuii]|uniref:Probable DNA ligase n=1 Tax=Mumia zhuanghuii TaxID=2585211 RepID=A0A5Q6RZ30_9ACTN|nr:MULTISPECIES: ATP-dependent DNA ligase [Mumia]KAA1423365.1 ATP-dependent DNA ligase [Mumia zhuanghuii]